jgi:GH24 family phage-related lysozyme (muramidase)
MSVWAVGIGVAVSAAAAGVSATQGAAQEKQAKQSMEQSKAAADKTAAQADQQFNQQNMKKPDTSAILSAAQQSGKMGASGTMLTGPQGAAPDPTQLGKSTLLGS